MKKMILFALLLLPVLGLAVPVHHITAETSRMSADTVKKRFNLKEGEEFTQASFERAQRDLQNLRVFKTLEFLNKERKDGMDIHIKADDRSYVIPMLFALSGNRHTVGASLTGRNVFKQGESIRLFAGGGRDGFDTHGRLVIARHTFSFGYAHLNFNQRFYKDGWVSNSDIFSPVDDKDQYSKVFLHELHGRQDDFYLSYQYRFSSIWSVFVTPTYEYYKYHNHALDTGNHSHLSFGLQYADDIRPSMDMAQLVGVEELRKEEMLRDLPRPRSGKMAQIAYTTGGKWTGSDYDIEKISVGGNYMWEFRKRHVLAVFAKAQRAFNAPFSNQVESSDLLFGMGIYDREQRGKGGLSGGISLTYYLMRNQIGLLGVTPFYEQAYITSGGNSYQPHSGVGVSLGYRFWHIPVPLYLSFTHNLNDGSHHMGCKLGGNF